MTGSFTSASVGNTTVTVSDLSEIKYIAVFESHNPIACSAIDLTDDSNQYVVASGTYLQFGFVGSTSAVTSNTFTWRWNSAVNFKYVAYGK